MRRQTRYDVRRADKLGIKVEKNSTIDGKEYSSTNPIIPAGFKAIDTEDMIVVYENTLEEKELFAIRYVLDQENKGIVYVYTKENIEGLQIGNRYVFLIRYEPRESRYEQKYNCRN